MITLGSLSLPDDVRWTNRSELSAMALSVKRRLDGGVALFARGWEKGRSILLEIAEDGAITRAEQLALEALASVPGAIYALEIPGEGFSASVMFDSRGGAALDLRPLVWFEDPAADDLVFGSIKLLTV